MPHIKHRKHLTWVIPSYNSEGSTPREIPSEEFHLIGKRRTGGPQQDSPLWPFATFATEFSQSLRQSWFQLIELPGITPLHLLSEIRVVNVVKSAIIGPAHSWPQRTATVCADTDLSWLSCTETMPLCFPRKRWLHPQICRHQYKLIRNMKKQGYITLPNNFPVCDPEEMEICELLEKRIQNNYFKDVWWNSR